MSRRFRPLIRLVALLAVVGSLSACVVYPGHHHGHGGGWGYGRGYGGWR